MFFSMSVKKTIESLHQQEFAKIAEGLNKLASEVVRQVSVKGDEVSAKLLAKTSPTWKSRVIAIRNWLTHLILWFILAQLLSSCFVSGRTIHVVTPKVDVSADTATAYTWPYNSKFQ